MNFSQALDRIKWGQPMTRTAWNDSTVYVYRVDHADDRGIHRRVFHALRQTRAGTGNDQNALVKARADGVDGGDRVADRRARGVERLDELDLERPGLFVLPGRPDRADDLGGTYYPEIAKLVRPLSEVEKKAGRGVH